MRFKPIAQKPGRKKRKGGHSADTLKPSRKTPPKSQQRPTRETQNRTKSKQNPKPTVNTTDPDRGQQTEGVEKIENKIVKFAQEMAALIVRNGLVRILSKAKVWLSLNLPQ